LPQTEANGRWQFVFGSEGDCRCVGVGRQRTLEKWARANFSERAARIQAFSWTNDVPSRKQFSRVVLVWLLMPTALLAGWQLPECICSTGEHRFFCGGSIEFAACACHEGQVAGEGATHGCHACCSKLSRNVTTTCCSAVSGKNCSGCTPVLRIADSLTFAQPPAFCMSGLECVVIDQFVATQPVLAGAFCHRTVDTGPPVALVIAHLCLRI
jgi:hypothetical protein